MKQYHKIQTVYLRNPQDNFSTLLEGKFALPEFEYLKDNEWVWTEKIDGTNIRVIFDGNISFKGKTDKAQIPQHLLEYLTDKFTTSILRKQFFEDVGVCLYGEGYGVKIQKGGNYIQDGVGFILFDCQVGEWWLQRDDLEEISETLNIPIVPIIGKGTLIEAVEYCRNGYKSTIAQNRDYNAEGLVLKPSVEMFGRNGKRIISKIKHKDF